VIFRPKIHKDGRGSFSESFRQDVFIQETGTDSDFVQENLAFNRKKNTLRGLHFQAPPHAQGKLVRCQKGAILDVIVDIRSGSRSYGQTISVELTSEDQASLWVPPGFLHGYITQTARCEVVYKVTAYYAPDAERSVRWDDPDLAIDWGPNKPVLSAKDKAAGSFANLHSPF